MRFGFLLLLAACAERSAGRTTPPTPPPAPAAPPAEPAAVFDDGCSCAELTAPLKVPADPYQRARWERAADELDALHAAIAALLVDNRCPPTIGTDVARLLAVHAHAIREDSELDAESCDQFSRWRFERRDGAADKVVLEMVRSGCAALTDQQGDQLAGLLVTRTCTTVSRTSE